MRQIQPGATRDASSSTFVRAELDRILASEVFSRSERLSAFLRFIVEQTLNGQGDTLKEQIVAIELYGKGPDSTPQRIRSFASTPAACAIGFASTTRWPRIRPS